MHRRRLVVRKFRSAAWLVQLEIEDRRALGPAEYGVRWFERRNPERVRVVHGIVPDHWFVHAFGFESADI